MGVEPRVPLLMLMVARRISRMQTRGIAFGRVLERMLVSPRFTACILRADPDGRAP
jgi:hypothetical protein